jgi:glyoxylase-like metal-dependent hydrolase (beta-lactamase superfamily II)
MAAVLLMITATAVALEPHPLCDERFLFHQLLVGRDVAVPEQATGAQQRAVFNFARQMQNFMYLVGDAVTRECVVVDPCYDPEGILAAAESIGCNVTAAVGTHFHYDHIGHNNQVPMGPGLVLPGLRHFVEELWLPGYVHALEKDAAAMQIGIPADWLTPLDEGEVVRVGAVELRVIHTPGHSPGGMTLVAGVKGEEEERLVLTGDTIFPGSCGRLDLPGSSVHAMWESLQTLRERLADALPLFPGHAYNGESSTVAREKAAGLLRPITLSQWRRMMEK